MMYIYNVVAPTTFCRKNIQQITLNQNLLFNTIISGGVKNLWILKGTSIVDHKKLIIISSPLIIVTVTTSFSSYPYPKDTDLITTTQTGVTI